MNTDNTIAKCWYSDYLAKDAEYEKDTVKKLRDMVDEAAKDGIISYTTAACLIKELTARLKMGMEKMDMSKRILDEVREEMELI